MARAEIPGAAVPSVLPPTTTADRKGFENYLRPPTVTSHHRRKTEATEDDKLFSGSSTSFQQVRRD